MPADITRAVENYNLFGKNFSVSGAELTDPSKAYDFLNHDLLAEVLQDFILGRLLFNLFLSLFDRRWYWDVMTK